MSAWDCPLCGTPGTPDDRRPAEIGGLEFRSVVCDQPPQDLSDHMFPVRWLETQVPDTAAVVDFEKRFVFVRGPLPEGSAIAEAFGDIDPIRAWIEHFEDDDDVRLLIRL